jgi:hypothetical protein
MNEEEKLKWMFNQVHGELSGSCNLVIDDRNGEIGAHVMKGGNLCWSTTKIDLVFDFLTMHLDDLIN